MSAFLSRLEMKCSGKKGNSEAHVLIETEKNPNMPLQRPSCQDADWLFCRKKGFPDRM